jgi:hypothetical protein
MTALVWDRYDVGWTLPREGHTRWTWWADPTTHQPTSNACLASAWSDGYFQRILNFIDATKFDLIETDGPYVCPEKRMGMAMQSLACNLDG